MTKLTVAQIKELGEFKAVAASSGKKASFKVIDDTKAVAAFEDGTSKEIKLDTISKMWRFEDAAGAAVEGEGAPAVEVAPKAEKTAEEIAAEKAAAKAEAKAKKDAEKAEAKAKREADKAAAKAKAEADKKAKEEEAAAKQAGLKAPLPQPEEKFEARVTEKEAAVFNVLAGLIMTTADGVSTFDLVDIAQRADMKARVVKGILGSLVKKRFVESKEVKEGENTIDVFYIMPDYANKVVVPNSESSVGTERRQRTPVKPANAETFSAAIASGELKVLKDKSNEVFQHTFYEFGGVMLEYYKGKTADWELLKSKKNGGYHGEFLKIEGARVKDVKLASGESIKEPSKNKGFVQKYLQEKFGIAVEL